nr:MAG TPA: hypothetical protein [Caudoviricetes sp.]
MHFDFWHKKTPLDWSTIGRKSSGVIPANA